MKFTKGIFRIICVIVWAYLLRNTDAYYSIYVLIGIGSVLSTIMLYKKESSLDKRGYFWTYIFSALISILVCMANYSLVFYNGLIGNSTYICKILLVLVGFITIESISEYSFDRLKGFSWKNTDYKISPVLLWTIVMVILSIAYFIVLNERMYPGVLTADSIDQINQAISGHYSNHHPVYHTFIIRLFLLIGIELLGMSVSSSIAFYVLFQIPFVAASFSYGIMTLRQINVPKWLLVLTVCTFTFLPYHFIYAVTVWKDIPFGVFVMLFIITLFRIIADIGKYKWLNYAIFVISGLGFCLFRSNGMFAYVVTFIIFTIIYKFQSKKVLLMLLAILVGSIVLKYPVLKGLNIQQHDTIEALSIPAQQVARVVTEGRDISEDDKILINNVADYEKIPQSYQPWLSDPIKDLVRESGNMDEIKNNRVQYIQLYIRLGIQYPMDYIHAWIDQTKGYWNGGYKYWISADGVYRNEYGIHNLIGNEQIAAIIDQYCNLFYNSVIFRVFISIGLNIWITFGMLVLCIIKKSRKAILTIPVLAVWLSILVSTPLYSEFRYIYAAFTALPFIIIAIFSKKEI